MSEARRQKRESSRMYKKSRRQIDWIKIKKESKSLLFIFIGFFLLMLIFSSYSIYSNNKIRSLVSNNPKITTGKVISKASGKGPHNANYEFYANGIKYSGSTFNTYTGSVGESICIEYLEDKPVINLYCDETEMEDYFSASFLFSLEMLGIVFGFLVVYIIWKILTNDKKIIAEVTSRKK